MFASSQLTADIESDETVEDSGHTADPVALVGYPPKKDSHGLRRLYEKPGSETYVEVKLADIVQPPRVGAKPRLDPGQIEIWVQGQAHVHLVEYAVVSMRRGYWPRH